MQWIMGSIIYYIFWTVVIKIKAMGDFKVYSSIGYMLMTLKNALIKELSFGQIE